MKRFLASFIVAVLILTAPGLPCYAAAGTIIGQGSVTSVPAGLQGPVRGVAPVNQLSNLSLGLSPIGLKGSLAPETAAPTPAVQGFAAPVAALSVRVPVLLPTFLESPARYLDIPHRVIPHDWNAARSADSAPPVIMDGRKESSNGIKTGKDNGNGEGPLSQLNDILGRLGKDQDSKTPGHDIELRRFDGAKDDKAAESEIAGVEAPSQAAREGGLTPQKALDILNIHERLAPIIPVDAHFVPVPLAANEATEGNKMGNVPVATPSNQIVNLEKSVNETASSEQPETGLNKLFEQDGQKKALIGQPDSVPPGNTVGNPRPNDIIGVSVVFSLGAFFRQKHCDTIRSMGTRLGVQFKLKEFHTGSLRSDFTLLVVGEPEKVLSLLREVESLANDRTLYGSDSSGRIRPLDLNSLVKEKK